MKKEKWLIYTVAIGLLPFLIRFGMYIVANVPDKFLMNEADFVVFGLVLNLSNLNELEHRSASSWKTKMIGLSLLQIAFYSGVLVLSYVTEIENQNLIKEDLLFYLSLLIAVLSFVLGYIIIDRLNKVEDGND